MQEFSTPTSQPQQFQQIAAGLSPETEKLLNKWLKMQITQYYWGMFTRTTLFLLFVISTIYSIYTLAPFIRSQMGTLQTLQSTINSVSSGTYGIPQPANNTTSPANSSNNDIINQLTPDQKKLILDYLEKSK